MIQGPEAGQAAFRSILPETFNRTHSLQFLHRQGFPSSLTNRPKKDPT